MAIQIEITNISKTRVVAAFYYPVPQALYEDASNNQSRVPLGTRLSAAERQDLKDGTLFEFIIERNRPNGASLDLIRTTLENLYVTQQSNAAKRYKDLYGGRTTAWDGTVWS